MSNIITAGNATNNGTSISSDTSGVLELKTGSTPTTAIAVDASQNVGIGTSSPTTLVDLAKSNTSGNDNQMPNLFVRNTNATQGNGGSTFNQAVVFVSAGNSAVGGGIRAAYDSAGSYGTGMQLYVNSTNPLQFYTNGSERMRIDSSGNLLVGTTSTVSSSKTTIDYSGGGRGLAIVGPSVAAGNQSINFWAGGTQVGSVSITTTATSYNTSSDYRLKNTVAPMTGALAKVAALKPCTYKWNTDGSDGQGFIAHELAEVVPECVTGEKDAVDADGKPVYQGIDTSFLVATLTAAIQELKAELDATKAEVAALKGA
jgi:hypothetical protein